MAIDENAPLSLFDDSVEGFRRNARHLNWIQQIKDVKKQHFILEIVQEIRDEGYAEKQAVAKITREKGE